MKQFITKIKAWLTDHEMTNEQMAMLIQFAAWLEPFVKDAKNELAVEYGCGTHTVGDYTVRVTETASTMTVKGKKELEQIGVTPTSNPELFKEKSGSVRVSVK